MKTETLDNVGQQVAKDVFCLPVVMVNVCFIGNPNTENSEWILIDTGLANSTNQIIETAGKLFGSSSQPKAIILTHGHFDHVGAIAELTKRWNNVPVYAHELEMPYLTGQADYPPGDPTVGGGLLARISPAYPHHSINLGKNVKPLPADGSVPAMPGWRWIHTPGHTAGHISLFRDHDRLLISGDAFITVNQESALDVLTQHKEVNGPPAYFTTDWKAAWESVKQLEALNPLTVVPGHGLPLSGEQLSRELENLARHFDRLAIPEQGRYVP